MPSGGTRPRGRPGNNGRPVGAAELGAARRQAPIKWLGDGVMFYFRDPGPRVRAGLDGGRPGRRRASPAHVGLHAGPVLFQEGDSFGQTANLSARIAD